MNKMKNITVRTILKSNQNIVERGQIDTNFRALRIFFYCITGKGETIHTVLEVHAGRDGRCHVFFKYEVTYVLAEIINI
jgi:hypothetical protein